MHGGIIHEGGGIIYGGGVTIHGILRHIFCERCGISFKFSQLYPLFSRLMLVKRCFVVRSGLESYLVSGTFSVAPLSSFLL